MPPGINRFLPIRSFLEFKPKRFKEFHENPAVLRFIIHNQDPVMGLIRR